MVSSNKTYCTTLLISILYFSNPGNAFVGSSRFFHDTRSLQKGSSSLYYANDEDAVQPDELFAMSAQNQTLSSKHDRNWNERYKELERFFQTHGHTHVSTKHDRRLGNWVRNQKQSFNEKRLTEERIKMLNAIHFCWNSTTETSSRSKFDKYIQELKEFKAIYGHCNVSRKHDKKYHELAKFVSMQRHYYKLYKRGGASRISDERIKILKDLGFNFNFEQGLTVLWLNMFEELKQFYNEHGHCKVPQVYAKNPKMGQWVKSQRTQYRLLQNGKHSSMTKARIKLLESIGFIWEANNTAFHQRQIRDASLQNAIETMMQKKKTSLVRQQSYSQDPEALLAHYQRKSLWGLS